ncbi:MAG TPA: signal peptidase II [Longimicrobiaceae bacterium]|nr:signal peptidase II [Longimicrobiaceae bacterium]
MEHLTLLLRRLQGERRAYPDGGRRRSDWEPNQGWRIVLTITLAVAALDWLIKALVAASVPLGEFVEVWPGRLGLWHVRNHAMMLGLWDGLPLPARKAIAAAAGVIAFFVFFRIVRRGHRLPAEKRGWAWAFIGLAFGGMLGNLGERLVHWGVTDYLSFRWGDHWLPPGNVADAALLLSIPLAVPVVLFELQARSLRGTGRPMAGPALSGTVTSAPRA